MTDSPNAHWEERARRLGLDPTQQDRGRRRLVVAAGIHDLTEKLAAPVLAEQEPTVAPSGPDAREASDLVLRLATVRHASGISRVTDRDALAEIERRFTEIPLDGHSPGPGPITVTAQNPLIINSTQSVTNYTTVTIEPGGYIEISIDCLFRAQQLIKAGNVEAAAGASADITITGTPGAGGVPSTPGAPGAAGAAGSPGQCDCCGGIALKNGTAGANGSNGADGGQAGNGKAGGLGPTVVIEIDDLASTVSLINVGGAGGNGGVGGGGGAGGNGGDGGRDKTCAAEHCDGGNGGTGANGGNGGNGGNSGDGGSGGKSVVHFSSANGSTFLVTNAAAAPGNPGMGGSVGIGGNGGATGGRGASPGANGQPGQKPGSNGTSGVPGRPGEVKVNPAIKQDR